MTFFYVITAPALSLRTALQPRPSTCILQCTSALYQLQNAEPRPLVAVTFLFFVAVTVICGLLMSDGTIIDHVDGDMQVLRNDMCIDMFPETCIDTCLYRRVCRYSYKHLYRYAYRHCAHMSTHMYAVMYTHACSHVYGHAYLRIFRMAPPSIVRLCLRVPDCSPADCRPATAPARPTEFAGPVYSLTGFTDC